MPDRHPDSDGLFSVIDTTQKESGVSNLCSSTFFRFWENLCKKTNRIDTRAVGIYVSPEKSVWGYTSLGTLNGTDIHLPAVSTSASFLSYKFEFLRFKESQKWALVNTSNHVVSLLNAFLASESPLRREWAVALQVRQPPRIHTKTVRRRWNECKGSVFGAEFLRQSEKSANFLGYLTKKQ